MNYDLAYAASSLGKPMSDSITAYQVAAFGKTKDGGSPTGHCPCSSNPP